MSSKNGSISRRVLYSEIRRLPRATRPARPCGTVAAEKGMPMLGWIPAGPCGPVVSKRKLILIYRKGKKRKRRREDGEATSVWQCEESRGAHGKPCKSGVKGRESGRQKRIMDTMLDGARSSSRKAGACTRPGSSLRKDYVEWMFICFWLPRRRAAVINVEFDLP